MKSLPNGSLIEIIRMGPGCRRFSSGCFWNGKATFFPNMVHWIQGFGGLMVLFTAPNEMKAVSF